MCPRGRRRCFRRIAPRIVPALLQNVVGCVEATTMRPRGRRRCIAGGATLRCARRRCVGAMGHSAEGSSRRRRNLAEVRDVVISSTSFAPHVAPRVIGRSAPRVVPRAPHVDAVALGNDDAPTWAPPRFEDLLHESFGVASERLAASSQRRCAHVGASIARANRHRFPLNIS